MANLISQVFSGVGICSTGQALTVTNCLTGVGALCVTVSPPLTTIGGGLVVNGPITAQLFTGGIRANTGVITGAVTLTTAQSGTWFRIDQDGTTPFTVTLPTGDVSGLNYRFLLRTADSEDTTITAGSNTLQGTIIDPEETIFQVNGDTIIVFSGSDAIPGDSIFLYGVSSGVWGVNAISITPGGIFSTSP